MQVATKISAELRILANEQQAAILSGFFKTGKGEYGEGDRFLGVKVPQTRALVKRFHKAATITDVDLLTKSGYHEERLAGFLLLIELYNAAAKKNDADTVEDILSYYLSILERGNNWDLVDLVAPKILGDAIFNNKSKEIESIKLLSSNSLWKIRTAIVSTLPLIKHGDFDLAIDAVTIMKSHEHDLIHKACGWMLREIGKKDRNVLTAYLDKYCMQLPRTTLRYAIEHLEPRDRMNYMTRKDEAIRLSRKGAPENPPAEAIPMSHRLSIHKKN